MKKDTHKREADMHNLNSILLEGNLTEDPEFGHTSKGTLFCTFTIASERWYKFEGVRKQEVSSFRIMAWANIADTCEKKLKKGKGVRVVGYLKQCHQEDADGKIQSQIYVVADYIEFHSILDIVKGGTGA